MTFDANIESARGARTPSEELEMFHDRMQKRQERLGVEQLSQEQRENIAAQELVAYRGEMPDGALSPEFRMSDQEIETQARIIAGERGREMDDLMGILVEKGLKNTLAVAEKIGNPHLSDDLHRFLIQYLSEGMDVRGLKEGTPLFKALHMKLFEVTLPDIVDVTEGFAQLVRAMEQFYSGMLSIHEHSRLRSYFTLEIALSSSSDDVVFYVAVPHAKVALFEKQIMATFPNAQIAPHKEDYNPFSEGGAASCSIAKLTRPPVMPLRTFESFEQDPLNVILGTFAKLKREGDGAAIQLVVAPVKDEINREYQEVLREVKQGVSLNRALEGAAMKVAREIVGVAGILFGGAKKEKEKEKEAADVDQSEVAAVTEKISSPIVNANVRIVGSAATKERADEIVKDIESAFHQFANEPLNSIGFRRVEGSGLRQALHDFSFRLYSDKQAIRLNLKEMTTMFHFPVTRTVSSELKQSKLVSAPAPQNMQPGGVFIGLNSHRGVEQEVYFAPEDRMRHFYVIGQTGTGKTTLLKNMIMQDIMNGEGVCYIDPHGTDIEDILNAVPEHRKGDVIYFDPGDTQRPIGLNMLEYDLTHPEQKSFVINEMLSIFNKLFDMKVAGGPMFEQYFRNATSLVIEDPESGNTLLDVSRVLADSKFREMKLSRCKNPIVVQFWREIAAKAGGEASLANMVPYITNKFDVFLSNDIMRSIVVQERSSFNFRDVMDSRKILLVNLAKGRLGDINSHLIGLILVGKIFMAALSRVDILSARPPEFFLYIDEFQNITTDSISAILSEARKYRLGLNMAHQFIAQLDEGIRDAVFGNVGSMAVFRVGADDAEFLKTQFAPVFSAADIMKIPNHNAYVKMLAGGFPAKPFNIRTQRPLAGDPRIGAEVKEISRRTYGRDRAIVDALIHEKYAQKNPATAAVSLAQPVSGPASSPRSAAVAPALQAQPKTMPVIASQTPPMAASAVSRPPLFATPVQGIAAASAAPTSGLPPAAAVPQTPVPVPTFVPPPVPVSSPVVDVPTKRIRRAAVYTNPFGDTSDTHEPPEPVQAAAMAPAAHVAVAQPQRITIPVSYAEETPPAPAGAPASVPNIPPSFFPAKESLTMDEKRSGSTIFPIGGDAGVSNTVTVSQGVPAVSVDERSVRPGSETTSSAPKVPPVAAPSSKPFVASTPSKVDPYREPFA